MISAYFHVRSKGTSACSFRCAIVGDWLTVGSYGVAVILPKLSPRRPKNLMAAIRYFNSTTPTSYLTPLRPTLGDLSHITPL